MRFVMTRTLMSPDQPEIEISGDEFANAVRAKRCLFAMLGVEEKFVMALENYREFESELLEQSLAQSILFDYSYGSFQDRLYRVIRRLANVLSACRSFQDQTMHHISDIYGAEADAFRTAERIFSREYDGRLGFRTMVAIRNFSQHRSVPLHQLTTSHTRVDTAEPKSRVTVIPGIRLADLRTDAKFKRSILQELQQREQDTVDVRPLLRDYVGGLAQAHRDIRELLADDVQRWEAGITALIERWKAVVGNDLTGLCIMRTNDDGEESDAEDLFDEFLERRRELVQLTEHARFIGRTFVSNEISRGSGN